MPGAVTESCPAAVSPEALAPLQWELAAQLQVSLLPLIKQTQRPWPRCLAIRQHMNCCLPVLQVTPSSKQPALKAGVLKELAEGARRHPRLAAALAASGLLREGLQACQQLGEQQVEQVRGCLRLGCTACLRCCCGALLCCWPTLCYHLDLSEMYIKPAVQVMRCIALCAVTVKALGGEAAGCAASLASHAQQAGSGVGAEPPPAGLAEQLAAPAPRSL